MLKDETKTEFRIVATKRGVLDDVYYDFSLQEVGFDNGKPVFIVGHETKTDPAFTLSRYHSVGKKEEEPLVIEHFTKKTVLSQAMFEAVLNDMRDALSKPVIYDHEYS